MFIEEEYETGILVVNSITQLVLNLKEDLENNLYFLYENALEDGYHYLVTDPKLTL